jgi:hypothetical protein
MNITTRHVRPLTMQRQMGMQQQQAGEEKEPLTQEQRDAISSMLGTTVSNMLTARLKSFETQLHTKMGENFGKLLEDKLKEFKPAPPPDDPEPGGKGGKKDVALATMQKQLTDALTAMNEQKQLAAEATARFRSREIRDRVENALTAVGIPKGVHADAAFAFLRDRIVDDAEGDRINFRDDSGEEVDIVTGLKGWVKTEPAKLFIPPSGARGAGTRPRTGSGSDDANKPQTAEQVSRRVWGDLADNI